MLFACCCCYCGFSLSLSFFSHFCTSERLAAHTKKKQQQIAQTSFFSSHLYLSLLIHLFLSTSIFNLDLCLLLSRKSFTTCLPLAIYQRKLTETCAKQKEEKRMGGVTKGSCSCSKIGQHIYWPERWVKVSYVPISFG